MDIKRFTWTAEEEKLVLRSGWMPWQRTSLDMPYDTIFEEYVNFGFYAKLFGYRTCAIRRTEGVTTQTIVTYMTDSEEVSGKINRKMEELRAMRHVSPQMISEASHVEAPKLQTAQLKELAALKADGTIPAEEFDLMKRKIIQA